MSRRWPATKATRVLAALKRIGWREIRVVGSHRTLEREGWEPYSFSFHDKEEIGPRMLARISKSTGLEPGDL
jgi:predicted RNA binding protein YcfA (HicA-like mRNA interferase family)